MTSEIQDEDPKTADRILRAAEELLAVEGYERLSMRRIAAKVGISQAAIYRHYAGKAELVGRIVASGYARLVEMAEKAFSAPGSPEDRLRAAILGYLEVSLERPELFKAVMLRDIGPASRETAVMAGGVSARRRTFALLTELLERGMESGAFRKADPELAAQAIWAAMYGLAARLVLEGVAPGPRRRALIEAQADMLAAGIRGGEV